MLTAHAQGGYHRCMRSPRARRTRIILITLLCVAVLVLGAVLAVLVPILTHKSAGTSGQRVPDGYVDQVSATGADGRTRTLSVAGADGAKFDPEAVQPGESLTVSGEGFNAAIGIYVAVCAIPADPAAKPGPCLGGIPEGVTEGTADTSKLASAWVSSDWAWKAFATKGYDDKAKGAFSVDLMMPAKSQDGLDCTVTKCAITTRADHTAANDRVQDLFIPIRFAE